MESVFSNWNQSFLSYLPCISDGVIAYNVRQGDRRGTELDFVDFTYDGMRQENFLLDGLGQLTDGEIGDYNFRLDNQQLGIKG